MSKSYFLGKPVAAQIRENELKEEARINYALFGHSDPIQKLIDERNRNGGYTDEELRFKKYEEFVDKILEELASMK